MKKESLRRLLCLLTLFALVTGLLFTVSAAETTQPADSTDSDNFQMRIGARVTQQYDKIYLSGYVSSANTPISKLEFDIVYEEITTVRFVSGSGTNWLSDFDCRIGEIAGRGRIHVSFTAESAHEVSGDLFDCELSQVPEQSGTVTIRMENCVAYAPAEDGTTTAFYPSGFAPITLHIGENPADETTAPTEEVPSTETTAPAEETTPETTVPATGATQPPETVPDTTPVTQPSAPPRDTTPATQPQTPTVSSGKETKPTDNAPTDVPDTQAPTGDTTADTTAVTTEESSAVTAEPSTEAPQQDPAESVTAPTESRANPSVTDEPDSSDTPSGIPWQAVLVVIILAAAGGTCYVIYLQKKKSA